VAPQLSVVASPDSLWPPNHKLVSVSFAVQVNDACDLNPQVALISAVSSEPADDVGDGNTSLDIVDANVGTDNRNILLRAERSGTGSGRAYTITYRATDASNKSSSASATVTVPH